MNQRNIPKVGTCSTRADITEYIFSKGKIKKAYIIKKFHDCNIITLKVTILKTWWAFKNNGYRGRYITLKNGFYIVVNA